MKTLTLATAFVLAAAASVEAQTRQVKGRLTYEDRSTFGGAFTRPVRFVPVTVRVTWGFETVLTDSRGNFSAVFPAWKIWSGTTASIMFKPRNFAADVYLERGWFNTQMRWDRSVTVPGGTLPIDISGHVPRSQMSAQLNIAETIRQGRRYADARRGDTDGIGRVKVKYPVADRTYYNDWWGEIELEGPAWGGFGGSSFEDGFADQVILHEYGHHLTRDISGFGSWWGGKHSGCDDVGYAFAWDEGFASYYADAVRDAQRGTVDGAWGLEGTPGCGTPRTERVTSACLWDVHDHVTFFHRSLGSFSERHDRIQGRLVVDGKNLQRVIFEIFDKEIDWPNARDILGFHDAWVGRGLFVGSHAELDRILQHHGVEVNLRHPLPEYEPLWVVTWQDRVRRTEQFFAQVGLKNHTGFDYADLSPVVRITARSATGTGDIVLWEGRPTLRYYNGFAWMNVPVAFPSTAALGAYILQVDIDPADEIPEGVESNNVRLGYWPLLVIE